MFTETNKQKRKSDIYFGVQNEAKQKGSRFVVARRESKAKWNEPTSSIFTFSKRNTAIFQHCKKKIMYMYILLKNSFITYRFPVHQKPTYLKIKCRILKNILHFASTVCNEETSICFSSIIVLPSITCGCARANIFYCLCLQDTLAMLISRLNSKNNICSLATTGTNRTWFNAD